MRLSEDLREFIDLLNSNKVEYLVVGAFAVAWHGYPRFTADIDFLIRPTVANGHAVVATLKAFGFASLNITPEDLSHPEKVVQLGMQPNRIDLITSIAGVDFDEAWESRVEGSIDEVRVLFIGRDELIRNKEVTGRAKDLGDAAELRKRI